MKYWFDTKEIEVINERNKTFAVNTTEDEIISKYFEKIEPAEDGKCEWLTATDIAARVKDSISYPFTSDSARKFGTALVRTGYIWKKSGTKRYAVIDKLPISSYFGLNQPSMMVNQS